MTRGVARLRAQIERRFRTVETEIKLGASTLRLVHPASADDLISEDDFARDERLPYWADIWPSSIVLAERARSLHGSGRRLLELGCGIGLVAAAATLAGFEVMATDYYEDALRFARVNVARNTGVPLATRMIDWRALPGALGTFDVVLASDVLYERPYAALVARAFALALAPSGEGLLADPGRIAAPVFAAECANVGFTAERVARKPWVAGAIRQTIDLYRVRRAR